MATSDGVARQLITWRWCLAALWHLFLVAATVYCLYVIVPLVVEQFHGQFFTNYGGWDMTPATFEGFVVLQTVVCLPMALSALVNRKQGLAGRTIWAGLAVSLVFAWVSYALICVYSPRLPGYDLPQFRRTFWESLLGFDGMELLLFTTLSFACAAAFGSGPFSLLAAFCRRFMRRGTSSAAEPPPAS